MDTESAHSRRPLRRAVRPTEKAAARAIELRHRQSPPEGILWSRLRNRKLRGFKFRRQHPIGWFVADFYCHEAALIVEVDGACHVGARYLKDLERTAWLESCQCAVIRIAAGRIPKYLPDVLKRIGDKCEARMRELERKIPAGPPD